MLKPIVLAVTLGLSFPSVVLAQNVNTPVIETPALRLVVLPFKNITRRPEDAWLSESFSENVTLTLAKNTRVQVIERNRIQSVLKEQQFNQSAFVDPETAPLLGKLLGANKILLGNYQKIENTLMVTTRVVDVETGGVDRELITEVRGNAEDVLNLQARLNEGLLQSFALTPQRAPVVLGTKSNKAFVLCQQAIQLGRTGTLLDLEHSVSHLEKAIVADPNYGTAFAMLAEMLALKARYSENPQQTEAMLSRSLQLADEALKKAAEPDSVYRAIAEVHALRGEREQARQAIAEALKSNRDSIENWVAYLEYSDESASTLNQSLALKQRNDPWIQIALGEKFLEEAQQSLQGDTRSARALFSQARARLPKYPFIPLKLAEVYLLEENYPKALAQANIAVSLDPDNFLLPYLAAQTLMYSPYQKEVEAWLETSLRLNPDFGYNSLLMGYTQWRNGKMDQAMTYFRQAESVFPDNASLAFVRGKFNLAQGDYEAAKNYLKQALAQWNPSSDSRISRGAIYLKLGDIATHNQSFEEASKYYYQALNSERMVQSRAYLKLSRLQASKSDYTAALEHFNKYLQGRGYREPERAQMDQQYLFLLQKLTASPEDPGLLNDFGVLALLHKDYLAATHFFEQALKQSLSRAQSQSIHYNYGLARFHLEAWSEAERAFLQVLKMNPKHLNARYNLGLLYQRTNRNGQAKQTWKTLLELHPNHVQTQEALKSLPYPKLSLR